MHPLRMEPLKTAGIKKSFKGQVIRASFFRSSAFRRFGRAGPRKRETAGHPAFSSSSSIRSFDFSRTRPRMCCGKPKEKDGHDRGLPQNRNPFARFGQKRITHRLSKTSEGFYGDGLWPPPRRRSQRSKWYSATATSECRIFPVAISSGSCSMGTSRVTMSSP